MSTQAVTATVSGIQGGRSFNVTATDSVPGTSSTWNNQATTVTGSAQLGFAMTGRVVNCVQVSGTAGSIVWRIRNRVTQVTKAFGFGATNGGNGGSADTTQGGMIPPLQIAQDDVLEILTAAVA